MPPQKAQWFQAYHQIENQPCTPVPKAGQGLQTGTQVQGDFSYTPHHHFSRTHHPHDAHYWMQLFPANL